jgi:hypothetical protein
MMQGTTPLPPQTAVYHQPSSSAGPRHCPHLTRQSAGQHGAWAMHRILILGFALLGCGSRTELVVSDQRSTAGETPGGDASMSGNDSSAPGPCPVCPVAPACYAPAFACLFSDGCGYGWCCGNSGLCSGLGFSTLRSYPCDFGSVPRMCLWAGNPTPRQPNGDTCAVEQPTLPSYESCGSVRCGQGCTCLCENVCSCGF